MKKVLFLCVENSCRSQMAEAFANELGKGVLFALSAGSKPAVRINDTAVEVMKEKGIHLGGRHPKGIPDLPGHGWDYVVTMGCGDACPFIPAKGQPRDWAIPDPKDMALPEFRKVRDAIERKVRELVEEARDARP